MQEDLRLKWLRCSVSPAGVVAVMCGVAALANYCVVMPGITYVEELLAIGP